MQPGTPGGAPGNCMSWWGRRSGPLRHGCAHPESLAPLLRIVHRVITGFLLSFMARTHERQLRCGHCSAASSCALNPGRADARFAATAAVDRRSEEDGRVSIRGRPVLGSRLCGFPPGPCRAPTLRRRQIHLVVCAVPLLQCNRGAPTSATFRPLRYRRHWASRPRRADRKVAATWAAGDVT